jgi:hypothetical protein
MLLFQIFLLLFFLFAIVKVVARYRSGDVAMGWLVGWVALWLAAAVVVWWPDVTMPVARFFGITRGADLVVYLSVAGLFYLFFRVMVKLEKIDKQLTAVTRAVALKKDDVKSSRL